jgi:HD-GYP domain-containing protein (c-di-GMP phosphodiesterase class II)
MMENHTIFGHEILEPVPISDRIKLAVRHSHERWDGHGYPDGLAGENIPLAARIVAVADVLEAMTSDRPYRAARRPQTAVEEIELGAGTQFDPNVVKAFLRVWKKFHRTSSEMPARIHEPA